MNFQSKIRTEAGWNECIIGEFISKRAALAGFNLTYSLCQKADPWEGLGLDGFL